MAEMEEDLEDQVEPDVKVEEPANIMKFSAYNVNGNQNDGMYNTFFSINDMERYIGNFSQKQLPVNQIQSVAKKILFKKIHYHMIRR